MGKSWNFCNMLFQGHGFRLLSDRLVDVIGRVEEDHDGA